MQPDDSLNLLRDLWADDAVPAGLAERIMLNARHTPQRQNWWQTLVEALSTWQGAWNIKGPVLAAFLMLGILGGQLTSPAFSSDPLDATANIWSETR